MSDRAGDLMQRARGWLRELQQDGWLGPEAAAQFETLDRGMPADLFAPGTSARPLVVALFGGTGVGKSTLLNRLAGQRIARVGVERPTSREVTLFVHADAGLADLPAHVPLDQVQVVQHANAQQRDVLWIDMPDIDSVDERNRRCALSWLPHVDLVVYVISPERYRDDAGWRVLRERRQRHGWMFVLNRWDEGHPAQREDFQITLRTAGFFDPLILCTACVEGRAPEDEFDLIEQTLTALRAQHGAAELERLGHRARLSDLHRAVRGALPGLGDDKRWDDVTEALRRRWPATRASLLEGVDYALTGIAGRFAARERSLLDEVSRSARGAAGLLAGRSWLGRALGGMRLRPDDPTHAAQPDAPLSRPSGDDLELLLRPVWDDWAQARFVNLVESIEVDAERLGLPARPFAAAQHASGDSGEAVRSAAQQAVRSALARPTGPLQRIARDIAGVLSRVLPVLALLLIATVVITYFVRASTGAAGFLGADFAIHSLLLVLVAWGLPTAISYMLKPSAQRLVLAGLRSGFAQGLDQAFARVEQAVLELRARAEQLRRRGSSLAGALARAAQPPDTQSALVARLLAGDESRAAAPSPSARVDEPQRRE